MKVKDLLCALKDIHPDMPVVLEADHGHTTMHSTHCGTISVEDSSGYYKEHCYDGDGSEVFLIEGY